MGKKAGDKKDDSNKKIFSNIDLAISKLNSKYKKNLVKRGNELKPTYKVPFGFPLLDYCYDGGVPIGRIIEKLGKEHTFKTVEGLHALREFQNYCFNCNTPNALTTKWGKDKNGNPMIESCKCSNCKNPKQTVQLIVDYEKTLDVDFVRNFGIDLGGVIYTVPEQPSQVANIVQTFARDSSIGLILVDSVGAFSSDAETEKAFEDVNMNKGAITLNEIMRRWTSSLNYNSNSTKRPSTTIFVINQSYSNIGIYAYEIPQGGRGLRHAKSVSSKNKVVGEVFDEDTGELLGTHVKISNDKNKAGIPHRKVELFYNQDKLSKIGYCYPDKIDQYYFFAIKFGFLKKKGSWYNFGTYKWQGKQSVLDDFPHELIEMVEKKLYEND